MKIMNRKKTSAEPAQVYEKRVSADEIERRLVIGYIRAQGANLLVDGPVSWAGCFLNLQPESSLATLQAPATAVFNDFLRLPQVAVVFEREGLDSRNSYITERADLYVYTHPGSINIASRLGNDSVAQVALRNLANTAKITGGELQCAARASVTQWLGFHGLDVPTDSKQVSGLLSFLTMDIPAADHLGNYWDHLVGHESQSIILTADQHKEIRAVTARLVPRNQTLLDYLYNAHPHPPEAPSHENANHTISQLVAHESAHAVARQYLDRLSWYGADRANDVNAQDLEQLLVTAILLSLNPFIGAGEGRNKIGTFDIYAPERIDLPHFLIRENVEHYLVSNGRVSYALAPLASQLLLAFYAPELLVTGVPFEPVVGSVAWVEYVQTVSWVEWVARGASRAMTYQQVMDFGEVEPVTAQLKQVQGLVAIEAIIDWALINEVITHHALASSIDQTLEVAVSAYESFAECLIEAGKALLAPLPDRKGTALKALREAAPGCDFLEQKRLRHYLDTFGKSYKMSILDLYIEGDLADWDRWETPSLHDLYPALYALPSNQAVFEQQIRLHHRNLHCAMATNIKLAMSKMPPADREIFQNNKISFFTIRPPGGELVGTRPSATGLVGVNNQAPTLKESQAQKDQQTGRYGVVMIASQDNGNITCYEMLTLRGECRKNVRLGEMIVGSGKINTASRIDFSASMTVQTPAITPYYLPVDINCYTRGAELRQGISTKVVIEKLGVVSAPSGHLQPKRNLYSNFMNPQFERIAQFIVTHRYFATIHEFSAAATVLTEREATRSKAKAVANFIIDLAVPFKKCSADIASGQKDRVIDGIFGCIMDALGLVLTALGAATKTLDTLAKLGSATAKAISLARYAVRLTVSVLNPLDGVPTFAYQQITTAYKTGFRLRHQSMHIVDMATEQLRKFTSCAKSVDPGLMTHLKNMKQGTWRARGMAADAMDVCAILKNGHWYAINRHNRPWGKALADFMFTRERAVSRLYRKLPDSHGLQLLENSLPIARQKIDHAIQALSRPSLNFETNLTLGLFFGSTEQARTKLSNFLRLVKADFNGTSVANFIVDSARDNAPDLSIDPAKYREWKNPSTAAAANLQYLNISNTHLTDRFDMSGHHYAEIADDLVHVMFLAGPCTTDRVAATDSTNPATHARALDVAPLLNLASGSHPLPDDDPEEGFHDAGEALGNADSHTLAVALLSQLITDHAVGMANLNIIRAAVENSGGAAIEHEVLVLVNGD